MSRWRIGNIFAAIRRPVLSARYMQDLTLSNMEPSITNPCRPMAKTLSIMALSHRHRCRHSPARWKLDNGQYRIIFGDLKIEDVSQQLQELEAK